MRTYLKHKLNLSLLFTLLICLFSVNSFAYDAEIDGIFYNFNGDNAEVTYGTTSYAGNVVIPQTVWYNDKSYQVTSIGFNAFYKCYSLTSIHIPNSISSVGSNAFMDSHNITSVHITDIAAWCNISFFGATANPLHYAHKLYVDNQEVTDLVIPESVTRIGDYSFASCNLTSVTIPQSVTRIGDYAFSSCYSLTSITIPENIAYIGESAFTMTKWYDDWYDNLPDGLTYLGTVAFKYKGIMPENTTVVLKEGTTQVYSDCFYGCYNMISLTIPESVTSIGSRAFYQCSQMILNNIPEGVTSIGDEAFYYCWSLKSITIPSGVTTINPGAFKSCGSLESIIIPDDVAIISKEAFSGCQSLTSISIPNSVSYIGKKAFDGCLVLASISIPDSLTWIQESAFSNCRSLTTISIPNSVKAIDKKAFWYCDSLKTIYIGTGVTNIYSQAFYNCSALTDVYSYSEIVPSASGAFSGIPDNATLYVPASALEAYSEADGWSLFFKKIVPLPEEDTAIGIVKGNQNEQKDNGFYDLSGRKLSKPQRGINIIRNNDGTAKKVVVK